MPGPAAAGTTEYQLLAVAHHTVQIVHHLLGVIVLQPLLLGHAHPPLTPPTPPAAPSPSRPQGKRAGPASHDPRLDDHRNFVDRLQSALAAADLLQRPLHL